VKRFLGPVLGLGLLAAAIVVSCTINHVSNNFECENNADCIELGHNNRVCSDGLCIVPGGPSDAAVDTKVDAPGDTGAVCPAQCTSCNAGKMECTINCASAAGNCTNQVVCPAGWHCTVLCSPGNSCRNGINCLTSKSCTVECTGSQSCRNISCGPGPCDVNCAALQSCRGVSCGQSCACDVACSGPADCTNVICKSPGCTDIFTGGCTSMGNGCNTCQM
jgi:hypothetical protein